MKVEGKGEHVGFWLAIDVQHSSLLVVSAQSAARRRATSCPRVPTLLYVVVPSSPNHQLFDILAPADAEGKIATFEHADRYFYEQTDIIDRAKMEASCRSALSKIPKGSLFGAVHCAAIAPGKPWSNSLMDKLADFEKVMYVNATGTFLVDAAVADAINSQYLPLEVFHERVTEERGVIINLSSIVGHEIPARSLTYGVSKSKFCLYMNEALMDQRPSWVSLKLLPTFSRLSVSGSTPWRPPSSSPL